MKRQFLLKTFGGKLETISHGQAVIAKIGASDTRKVVSGKICINTKKIDHSYSSHDADGNVDAFWICQSENDGCEGAEDKFEYTSSWVVRIDPKTHQIISDDCSWIKIDKPAATKSPKSTTTDTEVDDDPMPENWEPSEKDLIFFK